MKRFRGPVDASHAAAAVGLETDTFLREIGEKSSLQNLGLTGLPDGGNVKRDAWTDRFDAVIAELYGSEPVPPPPPPPPPDDEVYIPDTISAQ